jgi:hypothetical protein
MYLQKVNGKKLYKKLFLVAILKATNEKSRIRIQICNSVVRVSGYGSESVPKCHGSTTLIL